VLAGKRGTILKNRYLIHSINHTFLLVDITPVGMPSEVLPLEGEKQTLSSIRFRSWRAAEQFLIKMGADLERLRKTRETLKATSLAVLTISD
jgi:hypothetical protein